MDNIIDSVAVFTDRPTTLTGIDKDTKPDVNMYEHHQLKYDHTAFVMQDLHKYLDEGEEDR